MPIYPQYVWTCDFRGTRRGRLSIRRWGRTHSSLISFRARLRELSSDIRLERFRAHLPSVCVNLWFSGKQEGRLSICRWGRTPSSLISFRARLRQLSNDIRLERVRAHLPSVCVNVWLSGTRRGRLSTRRWGGRFQQIYHLKCIYERFIIYYTRESATNYLQ